MVPLIKFELWHDDEAGKSYIEDFLDGIGDADAIRVLEILENDLSVLGFADLVRENKIRKVEGHEDLYYIRVNIKRDRRIRFFGCLVGQIMLLVHGVEKKPLRKLAEGHYDTAQKRIEKILSKNKT